MRLGVRGKLVLLATLVLLGVSSGFTWLTLALARQAIAEDLGARAIAGAFPDARGMRLVFLGNPDPETVARVSSW